MNGLLLLRDGVAGAAGTGRGDGSEGAVGARREGAGAATALARRTRFLRAGAAAAELLATVCLPASVDARTKGDLPRFAAAAAAAR